VDAYTDDNEEIAEGDPPIDLDRVGEVADIFANAATPLEALTVIYGDKLVVPS